MFAPKMAITFIHTADWQIGKTFGRFEPELRAQLRLARLNAIDRIADHARTRSARHVLVAGDIWDQDNPTERTLHNTLERLGQAQHVTWWLLPGNHDPARPNGLWHRILSGPHLPNNVRALLKPDPVAIEQDVYVLPAPLMSKDAGRDLTQWMDECVTPDGAIRIGLAHGSVQGFGEDEEGSSIISSTRARSAKLDYLALGDWHGKKQIDGRTWYAGTPEPEQFPRNEPGWCLAVTIENPGAAPEVEPLPTADYMWLKEVCTVSPGMTSVEIFERALTQAKITQKTLLQLTLTGQMRSDDAARLREDTRRHSDGLAYLDVRSGELQVLVESSDLDRLDHAGSLRAAGEQLLARTQDTSLSQVERRDAETALSLLFTFAADEAGEGAQ